MNNKQELTEYFYLNKQETNSYFLYDHLEKSYICTLALLVKVKVFEDF